MLTAGVLLLSGCDSADQDTSGHAHATGPSVIAPGKPGEAAETLSAEEAESRRPNDSPNSADFTYARMMITHHRQALEMTALAPSRAGTAKLRRLAQRITSAQKPEIRAMEGWLKNHEADEHTKGHEHGHEHEDGGGAHGDDGGHAHSASPGTGQDHDHDAMPGMATQAQLKKLRAARGANFDALFLRLMITHHAGAVTMATEVLSDGNNVQIEEMANDVIAQQTSEIQRMRKMT
ncbi:DUF305 domain-containing protein [Streptomyces sp. NA04227]|uniref:DUF305 domain-containing protein n=1 Tax=Streptomyces sp. NA04227 TaxID=2742136 RepID=UPI0020CA61A2|nr:DUF305 domain-containing protein [Streptomyces sp. NA04227]